MINEHNYSFDIDGFNVHIEKKFGQGEHFKDLHRNKLALQ